MKSKNIITVTCLMSLSACSTLTEGSTQQITVNTNPSGASCSLSRMTGGNDYVANPPPRNEQSGMSSEKEKPKPKPQTVEIVGNIEHTPGTITIQKSGNDITIKCEKSDYEPATYIDKSETAGATLGNFIIGGGIGSAIDRSNGSAYKYESNVNIPLNKE